MRILGMDPSLTQFGWCLIETTVRNPYDRVLCRGRFQTSSKTLYVDRYAEMRERVRILIQETNPDGVGLEYPVFHDLFSEGMYGLFLYVSEALRLERQNVVFFSPLQLKAHARAYLDRPKSWKMGKPDMVLAAKNHSFSSSAPKGHKGLISPSVLEGTASFGGPLTIGPSASWNHNEADAYWAATAASRFWLLHTKALSSMDLTDIEAKQFLEIRTPQKGKDAGKEIRQGLMYRESERFFIWGDAPEQQGRGFGVFGHRLLDSQLSPSLHGDVGSPT